MSTKLLLSIFPLALLALTACSSDDDNPVPEPTNGDDSNGWVYSKQSVATAPDWETLYNRQQAEREETTVDWTVDESQDFDTRSSMVIFMTAPETGITNPDSKGDKLAAFVGDECRGIATCETDANLRPHYNLVVRRKEADAQNFNFQLRYYSAFTGQTHISTDIAYAANTALGTYASPYSPTWQQTGDAIWHPFDIAYTLQLPWSAQAGDIFCAQNQDGEILFTQVCNDDSSSLTVGQSMLVTVLSRQAQPVITFAYYRASEHCIYSILTKSDAASDSTTLSFGTLDFSKALQ